MSSTDYSNAKIYKLVNSVDNEIYVGSTCLTLEKRLQYHRGTAKVRTNTKVYKHLNSIGFQNVSIELLEAYPCDNKVQLEVREKHWVNELKPSLNSRKPGKFHMTLQQKIDFVAQLNESYAKLKAQQHIDYNVS